MIRIILLDRAVSGNCWRARLQAALVGVPLERIEVDILAGENSQEAFLRLNPRGQVPVLLVHENGVLRPICDSLAIMMWLAARFGTGWLAVSPDDRAREQEWLAVAAAEHQSAIRAARGAMLFGVKPAGFALETSQHATRRCLAMMDGHLAKRRWLVTDHATIADIACFPYASLAGDTGVDLTAFPSLRRWIGDIEALPGFQSLSAQTGQERNWAEARDEINAMAAGRL